MLEASGANRFLIINADDLGYTSGVNRAIADCHVRGVVSSASLMANGNAFEDAVATIRELPGLGVGVHLALTELKPVASGHDLPGLVNAQGILPKSPSALFGAVLARAVSRQVLEFELESQVRKVVDRGVVPTHLDCHQHVHILPAILEVVVHVAEKCGIPWIRNPFDETPVMHTLLSIADKDRLVFVRQYLTTKIFAGFRSMFARRLRNAKLRCPDHFFGTAATGVWSEPIIHRLVKRLPAGVNELMTHPGECDSELLNQSTRLKESREQERAMLLAPAFKELLQSQQIILTHYGDVYR